MKGNRNFLIFWSKKAKIMAILCIKTLYLEEFFEQVSKATSSESYRN